MLETLQLYWEILWRRRPPSDLPYSPVLFAVTAAVSAVIGVGVNQAAARFAQLQTVKIEPGAPGFVIVPFVVLLGAAAYALVLRSFGQWSRALQTITAILGISLYTSTAVLLLLLAAVAVPESLASVRGLVGLAMIVISVYDVYVKAWILSQAIERSLALSVLVVLSLEIFVVLTGALLLGPQAAAGAGGG
jgi:hypothetical protein